MSLSLSYFQQEDVVSLAKGLIGKVLLSNIKGQKTGGIITETEAYKAPEDKASHAYKGRLTKRTEVIFQEGGRAYIYLCYGIHHLLNIVTGPSGTPHAILIRALEPTIGVDLMKRRRGEKMPLCKGPGTVSQALGITTAHTGLQLGSTLWVEGGIKSNFMIKAGPRVGIDYAEEWASKPWRFQLSL